MTDRTQAGAPALEPGWTIARTAEFLDCSPSSVRRLITAGALRVFYIGSAPRVLESSIAALQQAGGRRRKPRSRK